MARSIAFGIAVLLMLGPAASTNRAQDSLLQEMYGQGVHAYFSGNLAQAYELFTAAIDQGSQDPRCYYFRGLALAKQGRPDEAEADYQQGAELEASGAAIQINIGLALQRVQGAQRLQLEEHRYSARLAVRLKEARENKERYEQIQRNEPQVLRGGAPAAADAAPRQPPPPAATDPFAAGAGTPAPAATEAPAEPAATPPAGVDLFGTPAAPAAEADPLAAPAAPAADDATDPFADPAQPVEMPPEGETPAAAVDDPFGQPAMPADAGQADESTTDAADDPFGQPAMPADAGQAEQSTTDAADDPFGQPAMPADAEQADESTTDAADDPFGQPAMPADAEQADESTTDAADDPFGQPAMPADAEQAEESTTDAADDPFGQPIMPVEPAAAGQGQASADAETDDIFGAAPSAKPTTEPKEDALGANVPTAQAAEKKSTTKVDDEPAAKNDSDILGGADPFGAPPPAVMTEEEGKPKAGAKPAPKDDSDPFADDPA